MQSLFLPFRRCIGSLCRKIPCNYRTLLFALFTGSIFSVPLGVLLALTRRPFEPPEWTAPYYFSVVGVSFILLPFWTALTLRHEPPLRYIGIAAFGLAIILFLLALLFPAL
jgi:hypothetical protein